MSPPRGGPGWGLQKIPDTPRVTGAYHKATLGWFFEQIFINRVNMLRVASHKYPNRGVVHMGWVVFKISFPLREPRNPKEGLEHVVLRWDQWVCDLP